jgi:hypothetical protein
VAVLFLALQNHVQGLDGVLAKTTLLFSNRENRVEAPTFLLVPVHVLGELGPGLVIEDSADADYLVRQR